MDADTAPADFTFRTEVSRSATQGSQSDTSVRKCGSGGPLGRHSISMKMHSPGQSSAASITC